MSHFFQTYSLYFCHFLCNEWNIGGFVSFSTVWMWCEVGGVCFQHHVLNPYGFYNIAEVGVFVCDHSTNSQIKSQVNDSFRFFFCSTETMKNTFGAPFIVAYLPYTISGGTAAMYGNGKVFLDRKSNLKIKCFLLLWLEGSMPILIKPNFTHCH